MCYLIIAIGPFTTALVSRTKKSIMEGPCMHGWTVNIRCLDAQVGIKLSIEGALTMPIDTTDTLTPLK